MAPRKPFLLRLDPAVHDALASWAAAEFRSVNGHIEFLLRDALRRAGRKVVARADEAPQLAFDAEIAAAEAHGDAADTPRVPDRAAAPTPPAAEIVEPQADGA